MALELKISPSNVRYWLKKHGIKTDYFKSHSCGCGETDPTKFYGHKKNICGSCHSKYTLRKGQEKRKYAIDMLGGKCKECGYSRHLGSLDIHHLDPSMKDENFSSMRGWSQVKILEEIKNCVLLCKNCHAEVHGGFVEGFDR